MEASRLCAEMLTRRKIDAQPTRKGPRPDCLSGVIRGRGEGEGLLSSEAAWSTLLFTPEFAPGPVVWIFPIIVVGIYGLTFICFWLLCRRRFKLGRFVSLIVASMATVIFLGFAIAIAIRGL